MRKLALAALCGTLFLAGCSQDTPNPIEPTEPDASAAIKCIAPGFPIVQALAQISGARNLIGLYPVTKPKPLALALARVAEVAALWTVCKPAQAQAKVAAHTNILLNDFRTGQLIGGTSAATAGRVITHINTMWQGVGFQAPNLPIFPGTGTDFGVGLFTPGTALLVKTGSSNGAVKIPANGFTQPTLITIVLRPPTPNPFAGVEGEEVAPPFYEIVASNATNTHYLTGTNTAIVGFCVDDAINPEILGFNDPAIAHIAVAEGSNPGGFEILDNATSGQYDQLGLDCDQFSPPIGSLFDGGLRSFASNAPRYLSSAVASLLLPAKVEATVSAGKTGLGGLARSLSPFGVVDRSPGSLYQLEFWDGGEAGNGDPTERQFYDGETMEWSCDINDLCHPSVVLRDSQGMGIGGVPVTVTLIHLDVANGSFSEGSTTVVYTNSDESFSGGVGYASFDDLTINLEAEEGYPPGYFKLRFTAPGADPLDSGTFVVSWPTD
jgi:hypothetical protein